MKKLLKVIAVSAFLLSSAVNATIISGNHTTADGKNVALQGLEWLSLEHTMGLSRDTVEAAGGFTDNYGTHYDEGVWRYATTLETETLLRSLWGGVVGFSNANDDGANWWSDYFQLTAFDSITGIVYNRFESQNTFDYGEFMFGEVYRASGYGYTSVAAIKDYDQTYDAGNAFTAEFPFVYRGSTTILDIHSHTTDSGGLSRVSSLLVRTAPNVVPLPAPLVLMGLGLLALVLTKRRIV